MISVTTLTIVVFLLCAHYVGDYLLQTREMANNKSTSIKHLLKHVGVYTGSLVLLLLIGNFTNFAGQLDVVNILMYATFNGLIHFATDLYTSRAIKKAWETGQEYKTFSIMGLDQLIHSVSLIATIKLLFV